MKAWVLITGFVWLLICIAIAIYCACCWAKHQDRDGGF
jgi:hypothetical protein